MTEFEGKTFTEGTVEYTIHEHIAVLDCYRGSETPWQKEVNIVSWNGGVPKVDIRDWSETHERMSRGITLTEEQAMKLTKALADRFRSRARQEHAAPVKDDYTR